MKTCNNCKCKLEENEGTKPLATEVCTGWLCDVCYASHVKRQMPRCDKCGCEIADKVAIRHKGFRGDLTLCAECDKLRDLKVEKEAEERRERHAEIDRRAAEMEIEKRAEIDRRDELVEIPLGVLEDAIKDMKLDSERVEHLRFAFGSNDDRRVLCEKMERSIDSVLDKLKEFLPKEKADANMQ